MNTLLGKIRSCPAGTENRIRKLSILLVLALSIGACSGSYLKINFMWTTVHRLPPDERMLTLDASPEAVKAALATWVSENRGEVFYQAQDYDKIIVIDPDGERKFRRVNARARRQWESYEKNKVLVWEDSEWRWFTRDSESQIKEIPAAEKGHKFFVRMAQRSDTSEHKIITDWTTYAVPSGMNVITSGGNVVSAPPIIHATPTYSTTKTTLRFSSIIRFFIFKSKGKTKVYAFGLPEDSTAQVVANYGHSIGYDWWRQVDGRREALLVKSAYNFIRELDRAGKLVE